MADSFADSFVRGALLGQQHKKGQEDIARQKRQDAWDLEDRDIESKVLKHRITELKIADQLHARQAARENIQDLTGTPEADIPSNLAEVAPTPQVSAPAGMSGEGETPAFQMKPVAIPGLNELGVPGISVRPQTMEDQLHALFAQAQIKAATEPYTLTAPRGGSSKRMVGGREVATATGDPVLVPYVTRDANGVESTRYVTEEERAKLGPAIKQRLPQRTTTATSSGEDIADIVTAVRTGNQSADLAGYKGTDRLRIDAALSRSGFNSKMAIADERALRAHYQSLNSGEQQNLSVAAGVADGAMDDIEQLSAKWDAGGFGTYNAARLALAKSGGLGKQAQELATDLEGAIDAARDSIALIKSGGSQVQNRALDSVQKMLDPSFSSDKLKAQIGSLRTTVQYRTNAIRSAQAVLPSQSNAGGGFDFTYDPSNDTLK